MKYARLAIVSFMSGVVVSVSALAVAALPLERSGYATAIVLPYLVAALLLFGQVYAHAQVVWRMVAAAVVAAVFLVVAWWANRWLANYLYVLPLGMRIGVSIGLMAALFTLLASAGAVLARFTGVNLLRSQA